MTREALLRILLSQAKANGFEFRKWFEGHIEPEWPGSKSALHLLCRGSRYYALLFSHDFARCFWKQGAQMSFVVPAVSYTKAAAGGRIVTVSRKAFTRRTTKPDAWRYHLREMAASEDPLRYLKRFTPVQEDLAVTSHPPANLERVHAVQLSGSVE